MSKKFELVPTSSFTCSDEPLFRIRALRDIHVINSPIKHDLTGIENGGYVVKEGAIGGFVASSKNLSKTDNSWIFGDAKVYGDATVYGDSIVTDCASVSGKAEVTNRSIIRDNAMVIGGYISDSELRDRALVADQAKIIGSDLAGGIGIFDRSKIVSFRDMKKIPLTVTIGIAAKIESANDILAMTSVDAANNPIVAYRLDGDEDFVKTDEIAINYLGKYYTINLYRSFTENMGGGGHAAFYAAMKAKWNLEP